MNKKIMVVVLGMVLCAMIVYGVVEVSNTYIDMPDDGWIGDSVSTERIVFDSDGDDIELMGANVGIGTASPEYNLDVAGNMRLISTGPVLYFNETAPAKVFGIRVAGGVMRFGENNVLTDRMTIAGGGNVGIATSAPNTTLDVAGNVNIDGNLYVNGVTTGGSPFFHGEDLHSKDWFDAPADFTTDCYKDYNGYWNLVYYRDGVQVVELDSNYCDYFYGKKQLYQDNFDKVIVENGSRTIRPADIKYIGDEWVIDVAVVDKPVEPIEQEIIKG